MHVSKYITKYANQRECVRTYICIEVYVISERERERYVFRLQNMRVKGSM